MRLVQIGLVVAGIGALITLAMLFKNLIHTLSALTGALDLLQRDLAKLEGPLDTVDQLSSTVNEIQTSAKRAANTAIDTFQSSSQHFMKWVDSKTSIAPQNQESAPVQNQEAASQKAQSETPAEQAHFEPVQKKEPVSETAEKKNEIPPAPAQDVPQDEEIIEITLEKNDESQG